MSFIQKSGQNVSTSKRGQQKLLTLKEVVKKTVITQRPISRYPQYCPHRDEVVKLSYFEQRCVWNMPKYYEHGKPISSKL